MKVKNTPLTREDQTRAHWNNQRANRSMQFAIRRIDAGDMDRARARYIAEGGELPSSGPADHAYTTFVLTRALADLYAEEHPAGTWAPCAFGQVGFTTRGAIRYVVAKQS